MASSALAMGQDQAPPSTPPADSTPAQTIALTVTRNTPLQVALDKEVRVRKVGQPVHGRLVLPVYAFNRMVVPAGAEVNGHIAQIAGLSGKKRTMGILNADFTPARKIDVEFDELVLADGRRIPFDAVVTPGSGQVMRLVSTRDEKKKKTVGDATSEKMDEAKEEARRQWREAMKQIKEPGKMHRLKEFAVTQSPYRRQYVQPGTRFVAELEGPLDFGETTRTSEQLVAVGNEPVPDSTLKARLVAEVSSATATRGTPVTAVLTEPLYSPTHQLILPANSRLIGQVVKAKSARKLHHNGELRVIFERIETSDEAVQALAQLQMQAQQAQAERSQAMVGNLEGVEVDRRANMQLDEEGAARTTDSKTRYLSSGLAVMLAAAASHTEVEHGTTEMAGPGVRTAAGGSGFRLTGALLSLMAKSTPVSMAIGAYGASMSIYANFLSRGHDVILPKDTPLEIGFGPPHAKAP